MLHCHNFFYHIRELSYLLSELNAKVAKVKSPQRALFAVTSLFFLQLMCPSLVMPTGLHKIN